MISANPTKRVLIACGGTGGHLFPGIAIAQELQKKGHEAILLISQKSIDTQASEKYKDLVFYKVPAMAKPPLLSLRTPQFLYQLGRSYKTCRRIIQTDQIDIVLGMGGFTSLPPICAAHKLGIPCYIHESNALPGKANRLTGKLCDKIFIGLEEARPYFGSKECKHLGTPVRDELLSLLPKQEARQALGLNLTEKDTLILTVGGSQGAVNFNTRLLDAAQSDPDTHYLIIAGTNDVERVEMMSKSYPNIHVLGFCAQMDLAYAACDGIIARAGASTLCELSHLGKASLLVPFPFAADDHQSFNARAYSSKNAARLCQQQDLSPSAIKQFIKQDIKNLERRTELENNIRALSHPQAAQEIAAALCP